MTAQARRRRVFIATVFALYCAITLWTTLHHEAWGDEADVWLAMRDGGLRTLLPPTSAYRGTPALWYLAVWPFAASGAPYLAQQLLNLAFCWAAVLLVLTSAPFPPAVRALFAFSYFPAFEYAALARPYALMMLLIFAVAELWERRVERPVAVAAAVALLANTSLPGLIIAAAMGLALLIEWARAAAAARPRVIGALAMMTAGGLLSVWQIWPRPGGQEGFYRVMPDTLTYALGGAFFPERRAASAVWLVVPLLVIVLWSIRRSVSALLVTVVSLSAIVLVYVYVWMGGIRHAGILLLVVIAGIWIAAREGALRSPRVVAVALGLAMAASIPPAVRSWNAETRLPYSASRELAAALDEPRFRAVALAASHPAHAPLVYVPERRVWYASSGSYATYSPWDRAWQTAFKLTPAEVARQAESHFGGQRWLLLSRGEVTKAGWRELYRTDGEVWGTPAERFWLYEWVGP